MKKVAVIGLGIMGSAIADNFLKSGDVEVYVWNRGKAAMSKLVKKGALPTNSPAQATAKADVIFEVTANDESSREIWLSEDGILSAASEAKYLITCATLSVKWVDELARTCAVKGLNFFDMPMTGGRVGAEAGQLTLLVGGNLQKLDQLRPLLEIISKEVKYFGQDGAGTRYKLVLNMLQAIHIIGFAEAMKLARHAGLDEKLTAEALVQRPGGVLTEIAWEGYQKQPQPINFSVKWIDKDLHYAKQLAEKNELGILNEIIRIYDEAISHGLADNDWTKVIKT